MAAGEKVIRTGTTSRGPVEYLERGAGEPILCLHGAMGGYDQSDILGRTIGPPGWRYLALSRPGYLGTPLSAGRMPEEQADLYAELLDRLAIPRVVLFAISGGGPSAIHMALRHPARCRALVLASTTGGPAPNKVPLAFHVMTLMARLPAFTARLQRKAQDTGKSLARSVTDPEILARTLQDAEVMALYRELTLGMFDRMAERLPGTRNDIEVARTRSYPLADIAVPTLVVHGTRDPLVPFEQHGRRLASEIPGARLCKAEGGEHVAIFTHRAQVRSAVADFLQETP
jgi:pimeloyl-ACP methyl ester carboxylesterase